MCYRGCPHEGPNGCCTKEECVAQEPQNQGVWDKENGVWFHRKEKTEPVKVVSFPKLKDRKLSVFKWADGTAPHDYQIGDDDLELRVAEVFVEADLAKLFANAPKMLDALGKTAYVLSWKNCLRSSLAERITAAEEIIHSFFESFLKELGEKE